MKTLKRRSFLATLLALPVLACCLHWPGIDNKKKQAVAEPPNFDPPPGGWSVTEIDNEYLAEHHEYFLACPQLNPGGFTERPIADGGFPGDLSACPVGDNAQWFRMTDRVEIAGLFWKVTRSWGGWHILTDQDKNSY